MKRYSTPDIVFGPVSEDEEVHSVYKASEVQALLRAVADEVKGMEHETECEALEFDAGDSECNCQRGKVLAMLEVE